MTIDYPGQELIWELKCNHPYKKNSTSFSITIKCLSEENNDEYSNFFFKHLKTEDILDIKYAENIWNKFGKNIVKQIDVKNVFGNISTVYFYNTMDIRGIGKNIKIESNTIKRSLFDENEKDPSMRALNMVKEYCRVSCNHCKDDGNKSDYSAYQDVIQMIDDHQKKCGIDLNKISNDEKINHYENDVEWYKKRMEQYRESFFNVCYLIENSNSDDYIKHFISMEKKRY